MKSAAMYRNEIQKLEQDLSRQDVQHIHINEERTLIYGQEKDRIYVPSRTAKLVHHDNTFIRLVMGPYGSGKTTLCLHEIVRRTCAMPRWAAGNRRKARCIIIRNTSGELYSTTLQSWLSWFSELGSIRKRQKPILTYTHTFNDGKGIVELELIFLALDRPEDIRKLKSLETTFAYLNELSEIPQAVLAHIKGRLNGRYPSKSFCPEPYWSGILADTNPPDEDHWIYKDFEVNPSEDYKIFKQPSGLLEETTQDESGRMVHSFMKTDTGNYIQNYECDNYEHLSADYYPKLATKQSEGFIKVFCGGRYGIVESGQRVFTEYNDDLHSVAKIDAIQELPIHLCWDFGLTPACIVFQISARGQMRVLKEYESVNMGIRSFAKNIVIPGLMQTFPYNKIGESEADPAGMAADTIFEELSCIGELNNLGIKTNPASTNDPETRISSVRFFLNNMIDGHPGFILSREGCPTLRKGFVNGYYYKRLNVSGENQYHKKPNKNKFSHPQDALQYGALKFASDYILTQKLEKQDDMDFYNPGLAF